MNNYNKWLRWCFPVLTFIFLSLGINARLPDENRNHAPLNNDTLSCFIELGDVYRNKQYPVGYHYQILKEFVKAQDGDLRLAHLPDSVSLWEALLNNMVRVVVLDTARDTIPEYIKEQVIIGPFLNTKEHVWVYQKDDFEVMQAMNRWFNSFKYTAQYAHITSKFYAVSGALSPYDDIIKKQSAAIGWDWRMLAALICQESTFRMNVTSPKGAVGLMQVMYSSAERFGFNSISELYDPEENIRAGTLILKEITRQLRDTLVMDSEQIKFILAAYNAGPEQLRNCRDFAASQGKNPNVWSEVAQVIPLMRTNEFAHLFTRYFRGDETIRFVDEVLARYERYCEFLD